MPWKCDKILYFDTDSIIYVSATGEHLIIPDSSGALGLWTSELKAGDYYTEFVSTGPDELSQIFF